MSDVDIVPSCRAKARGFCKISKFTYKWKKDMDLRQGVFHNSVMEDTRHPIYDTNVMVRTAREAKEALDAIRAQVRRKRVFFQGKPISQDAFVNASWMWLEELGADAIAEGIAKYAARLESLGANASKSDYPAPLNHDHTTIVDPKTGKPLPKPAKGSARSQRKSG